MIFFKLICFILFVYGMSVIITQGVGPFGVFEMLRYWTDRINSNLGLLFRCMLCLPTNVGLVASVLNWFFLPSIQVTPFNIILYGTNLWWVAMILDGCIAGGVCHFLWNLDDYIDKITPIIEDYE